MQQRVKQAQGAYSLSGRASGRWQDLAGQEHRARDQPQVRSHVARRRARRGRNSRPSAHLHWLHAGQDCPEPDEGPGHEPAFSCWTRSTRCRWTFAAIRRRRCSKFLIRSRTTVRSPITTSKSTFDLSDTMFVCTANSAEHSRAAAGSDGGDPDVRATPKTRKVKHRRALPDSEADEATTGWRKNEMSTMSTATSAQISCATTRARQGSVTSSAKSRRFAARSSRQLLLEKGEPKPSWITPRNLRSISVCKRHRYGMAEETQPGRSGHRARVDRSRRRTADDRVGDRSRQRAS